MYNKAMVINSLTHSIHSASISKKWIYITHCLIHIYISYVILSDRLVYNLYHITIIKQENHVIIIIYNI